MMTTTTNIDRLNFLLRGEISATETYTQAVQKFSGQAEEPEIRRMRDEHRDACNVLRNHIHEHGAAPDTHSGPWGTWAKLVEGSAQAFGKAAAINVLKEGEEHGIKEYQSALDDQSMATECKDVLRSEMMHCQAHIPVLDRLIRQ
jgi:hypothetical protein